MTREQIYKAVTTMEAIIPFFPKEEMGQAIIADSISQMVTTEDQLKWLTRTACQTMTQFSLPVLRALYCSRFLPADGIGAAVDAPGCTEDQLEARYCMREMRENENRMREYKRLAAANPAEYTPVELPPIAKPETREPNPPATPKSSSRKPIERQQPKRDRSLQEAEQQLQKDLEAGDKRTAEERQRIVDDMMARIKTPSEVH